MRMVWSRDLHFAGRLLRLRLIVEWPNPGGVGGTEACIHRSEPIAATRVYRSEQIGPPMQFIYVLATYGACNIFQMDGIKGDPVITVKGEPLARRVVDLLNRHGMQDCDTQALADAILDLEQRK